MPKRSSARRAPSPDRPLMRRLERLGWRVVYTIMDHPYRLVVPAAAVIGAVMLGLSLGNSAISQINPVYFQGAAVHPRDRGAAVDPNAIPPAAPAYGEMYGFDEGRAARLEACEGCLVRPQVEYASYSAPAPYFGSREERASREARELREIDAVYAQRERRAEAAQAREEAAERLERYMTYPVTDEGGARPEPSAYPEKEEEFGATAQE